MDPQTVTMVAWVQETLVDACSSASDKGKPLLTVQEIGELGFDLALFGVTPLQCVVGALDAAAGNFLRGNEGGDAVGTGIIDHDGGRSAGIAMADFAAVKQLVGFNKLEGFEAEFPCA